MGKMEGKPEGWRMEKAGHSFRYLSGRLKQLLFFSLQKGYAERRDLALYDGRSKSKCLGNNTRIQMHLMIVLYNTTLLISCEFLDVQVVLL